MSGLLLPFKGTKNFTRKQFCFKANFIPLDAVAVLTQLKYGLLQLCSNGAQL